MRRAFVTLIMLIILIQVFFIPARAKDEDTAWFPYIFESIYRKQDVKIFQRNVIFKNLGIFFVRRADFKRSKDIYYSSYAIPGEKGTLQYFDSKRNLITEDLKDGVLPANRILYISTDKSYFILGQSFVYDDLGMGTRQSVEGSDLPARIENVGNKWLVTYQMPGKAGSHGILWGLGSQQPLLDDSNPETVRLWSECDLTRNARLAEDGYYYVSPSTYRPSSAASYWRIPSMYLARTFIEVGGSRASDMLGISLLMIAADNINEEGWLPSLPESQWLKNDYNIGSGFYDTRFNTDMINTYLDAYQKFKVTRFRDAYLNLSEYYGEHARLHHYINYSSEGEAGWLVEDYGGDPMGARTHVALNHQLQGIHVLLKVYEEEKDASCLELANCMILGITNIRDRWIMPNHNLIYSFKPDGTMGGNDYPSLTYNDLFNVQNDLLRIYGARNADLDVLMKEKEIWMDANGIKGYKR